jgi:Ca2+/H+ antiporter
MEGSNTIFRALCTFILACLPTTTDRQLQGKSDPEEIEELKLTLLFTLTLLIITTILIALCVDCLESNLDRFGVSKVFLRLIFFPSIRNVASRHILEHCSTPR